MITEISAGGVVHKKVGSDIYIALILGRDKVWTFPKGHLEKGEKPEEAAVREVGEEIGIPDLKAENLIEKIEYFFSQDNKKINKFVYYYLMQAPDHTELTPQLDEVDDARWFKASDVLNQLTYKQNVSVFKKALSLLKV